VGLDSSAAFTPTNISDGDCGDGWVGGKLEDKVLCGPLMLHLFMGLRRACCADNILTENYLPTHSNQLKSAVLKASYPKIST